MPYIYKEDGTTPMSGLFARSVADVYVKAHGKGFCSKSCAQRGANNSTWKGDKAGYGSFHQRVYRARGRAFGCTVCGDNSRSRCMTGRTSLGTMPTLMITLRCASSAIVSTIEPVIRIVVGGFIPGSASRSSREDERDDDPEGCGRRAWC